MKKIAVALSVGTATIFGAFFALNRVEAQSETQKPVFSYYPPGSIEPKSGAGAKPEFQLSTGYVDYTVHAPGIGFPLKLPAFPNSQVYRPGGEFYALKGDGKWQCDKSNYSYPWRDNYCEKRSWDVDDCQGGHGHQGQDIRPSTCVTDTHEVVAVEDGVISEIPALGELYVKSIDNKRLYDYFHMEFVRHKVKDNGGLLLDAKENPIEIPGTRVSFKKNDPIKRGQILGYVSTFSGGSRDVTSRHLHLALRKHRYDSSGKILYGGAFFYHSPYMSLVRAYEAALGTEGVMLSAPVICKAGTARCTDTSIVSCNSDGTSENLTPCKTTACKNDVICKTGVADPPPAKPPDLSLPPPKDMPTPPPPPDLTPSCRPEACICGCGGATCRAQSCTPYSTYCADSSRLFQCANDGCSFTFTPCPYGCSGNVCKDSSGMVPDMSMPVRDMAGVDLGRPTEICNGIDDDSNGIIDDRTECWTWITRFKDPITGARCYGVGSTPPFACAAYDREFTLFAVPSVAWSDGSNALWVQCSRGIDHVITKKDGGERVALEGLGWNCFLELGYFFNSGMGPRTPKRTPYANTCPLYRQRFSTSGSQSHLFTPFSESVTSAVCEPPARADVVAVSSCGLPVGC